MSILVVLRGNSGSGKSTVARAVQRRFDRSAVAVVPQDVVRRQILREEDKPDGLNVDLIEHIAGFGLERGLIVIVEGILRASHYSKMLQRLSAAADRSHFYAFDLSFEETTRRHATRPQATEFGITEMRSWYHGWDPLDFVPEVRLDASWTTAQAIDRVYSDIVG
ncbi:AAA family ATPase [Nocardia sp. XZ_19_385]|uniref:AAA family ATPase n=1 Tax=Nocardia sp. XZ_19_385 TaxID=2769488 RepID=UPI00188FC560|nr:AAA family ATPase [Nocardia sp. XZ_19_385]